jgi:hypothetical protein
MVLRGGVVSVVFPARIVAAIAAGWSTHDPVMLLRLPLAPCRAPTPPAFRCGREVGTWAGRANRVYWERWPVYGAQNLNNELAWGRHRLNRFLSKDFLSGLLFIGFGFAALYFGRNLAMGTAVRMGPGFVPHMLADIMMVLGCAVSVIALVGSGPARERESVWIPVGISALAFVVVVGFLLPHLFSDPPALLVQMSKDWLLLLAMTGVLVVLLSVVLITGAGRVHAEAEGVVDTVDLPRWKPITLVTIGIFCFALLFERVGLVPALAVLILIASLGGEEFKLIEVIINMAILAVLSILVFWIGLRMNIGILNIGSTDYGAMALEPVRNGIYALFDLLGDFFQYIGSIFGGR